MKSADTLKQIVKDKYADIVLDAEKKSCGCCDDKEPGYSIMSQDYTRKDGYVAEADLTRATYVTPSQIPGPT